jgi:hypothetical protein
MPEKNHKILIVFAILFLTVLPAGSIFAVNNLEQKYPSFFGYSITGVSGLAEYIAYFFAVGIAIGGVLALVSLAIGGITFIGSAGNPGATGDAKDRIKSAILGLILLMTSFLILQTINKTLVTPSITPVAGVDGIYYFKSDTDMIASGMSDSDTSPELNMGYTQIYYKCTNRPDLIIWKYPKTDFKMPMISWGEWDYSQVSIKIIPCGRTETISDALSFSLGYKTAGIYYYLGDQCTGFMSAVHTASDPVLTYPFKGRIKSVKIINSNTSYSVIAHKSENFSGGCTGPIFEDGCTNVTEEDYNTLLQNKNSFSSLTIFQINKDYASSGDGVTFYSLPYGYNGGTNSGFYSVNKNDNQFKKYYWEKEASKIEYSYAGINAVSGEKTIFSTFKKSPGAMKINGNYLVLLTSAGEAGGDGTEDGCPVPPNWYCNPWEICLKGTQNRLCVNLDYNGNSACKQSKIEKQACTSNTFLICRNNKCTLVGSNDGTASVCETKNQGDSCNASCIPSWSCSSWSACANGQQIKDCIDLNKCQPGSARTQECSEGDLDTQYKKCQVFSKTVSNFNWEEIIAQKYAIGLVQIWPTK